MGIADNRTLNFNGSKGGALTKKAVIIMDEA